MSLINQKDSRQNKSSVVKINLSLSEIFRIRNFWLIVGALFFSGWILIPSQTRAQTVTQAWVSAISGGVEVLKIEEGSFVYVATGRILRKYNKSDGSQAWSLDHGDAIVALALDQTGVYIGGGRGRLNGVFTNPLASVRRIFKASGSVHWSFDHGASVYALAVDNVEDGGVYLAGQPGYQNGISIYPLASVRRLSKGSGGIDWNYNHGATILRLKLDRNTLYIAGDPGSGSASVRQLLRTTGDVAWSFNHGGGQIRTLAFDSNYLYIGGVTAGDPLANVRKLDKTNGSVVWSFDHGSLSLIYALALDGENVYIAGDQGFVGSLPKANVRKLSKSGSGTPTTVHWSFDHGSRLHSIFLTTDNVYIGGFQGSTATAVKASVRRLSKAGSGSPTLHWSFDHGSTIVVVEVDSQGVYIGGAASLGISMRKLTESDPPPRTFGITSCGFNDYPNAEMDTYARIFSVQQRPFASSVIDLRPSAEGGGFAYFGDWASTVTKVNLANFTQSADSRLNISRTVVAGALTSAVIDTIAGFVYFGAFYSPGRIEKLRLSDFIWLSSLTLPSGEDNLTAAVIDPIGGYAYFATNGSPAKIIKINLNTFAREAVITLAANETKIKSAAIDLTAGMAYFGTEAVLIGSTPNSFIVKVNLSTFTRVGSLQLSNAGTVRSAIPQPFGGFAYFGVDSIAGAPARVIKLRLSDFSFTSASLGSGEERLGAMVMDSGRDFFYLATYISNSAQPRIIRFRISDFSRVASFDLRVGYDGSPVTGVIDPGGGAAYFGTVLSPFSIPPNPSTLVKIDIAAATFNVDNRLSDDNSFTSGVFDQAAGFAYFAGTAGGGRSGIVKVRLSDFTKLASLSLSDVNRNPTTGVIDPAGGFAYFGTDPPGGESRILKIRLSDFSLAGAAGAVGSRLWTSVIDPGAGFAYFGTLTSPGQILKVRLSDLTTVGTITLGIGKNSVLSSAIDVAGGAAYFGLGSGEIVKVALSTFTVAATLGTSIGTIGTDAKKSAVIDPARGFVYFGTGSSPARVVRISLTNFTSTGITPLEIPPYFSENNFVNAVIDQTRLFAYFIMESYPSNIVKINIQPTNFSRVGALSEYEIVASRKPFFLDQVTNLLYFGDTTKMSKLTTVFPKQAVRGYLAPLSEAASSVRSISFCSHLAAGNIRLAVYNFKRNLLWQSASVPVTTADDFQAVPISSGLPNTLNLPAGSYYLSFQYDSNQPAPSLFDLNGSTIIRDQSFGPFPTRVFDGISNAPRWSIFVTYDTADTTPPNTLITSAIDGNGAAVPNAGITSSTSITFNFSGTDNVGVVGFDCRKLPGLWAPCTSPKTYTSLVSGTHIFEVRAKDAAGNIDSTPASLFWIINRPPNTPKLIKPVNNVSTCTSDPDTPLNPLMDWNDFSDPDVGDTQQTFNIQIDNNADFSSPVLNFTPVSSTASAYTVVSGVLAYNMTYYWRVRVRDNNGLWSAFGTSGAAGETNQFRTPPHNLPIADFVFSPSPAVQNQETQFDATPSTAFGGSTIIRWRWNFGDGTAIVEGTDITLHKKPKHTYTTSGAKNVNLRVTDSDSCQGEVTKSVNVVQPAPLPIFRRVIPR